MKIEFKKRVIRTVLWMTLGFVVLFAFRFIYGYSTGMSEVQEEYFSDFFSELENVKHNYASSSYSYAKSEMREGGVVDGVTAQQVSVDQKYEKIANVKSRSRNFSSDEELLRKEIKSTNSIVQYEENSGRTGNRSLHVLIGVPPTKFDSLYERLLKIGSISSKDITKIDKTNEFANLQAKKASLEITRQSLLDIKKQSGKIDEYINLQNRILEIENELQSLGVLLGNFDAENEFCTIRFSLKETQVITISMLHRLKVAFEWTVQYYLLLLAILATASVFAFFFLLIIDKVIPGIVSRMNQ